MGRPWWHDSYWEKKRPTRRGPQLPGRQVLVWIVVVVVAIIVTTSSTGFQPILVVWLFAFLYYLCRILAYAIIIRAILSWFVRSRQNLLLMILDDITEPILAPLRRIIPRFGLFDISPLAAIILLYLISFMLGLLLT